LYKYLPFKFAAFIDKFGVNLSYIFTIVLILRYIGFPTPFDYYKKLMAHVYFKKIEKIYNKSLNSKLSEQDIKTLKETEKRFEEYIENEQVSKIIREIKKRILYGAEDNDLAIIEIGGTVGDIESQPFLEAIRQMKLELGSERTLFTHLTFVPYLASSGETKTKPTQHSVKKLRSIGIQPDLLVCRSDKSINEGLKKKLSGFCGVNIN